MSQSGLEPETYGLKVVPSAAFESTLKPFASSHYENQSTADDCDVQRKAQQYQAKVASVDGETDPQLASIIDAWPRLLDSVKAAILKMVESAAR